MSMKRLICAFVLTFALVLASNAFAGTLTYAGYQYWPAGQTASTSYSPSWYRTIFYKTSRFDTTLTFIDNASYSWHSTVRSWGTYLETHWLSSQTKKAHCRANTSGSSWAACTAYS